MIAKLIVEGKEFPIEIQDSELQKMLTPQKETGYERVDGSKTYYYQDCNGDVEFKYDHSDVFDVACYNDGNYYSNKIIAENNTRADKLMRQLRRFAVEHRKKEIDLSNLNKRAYYICYDHINGCLNVAGINTYQTYGVIYFDMEDTAQLAIKTFRDELIWYFTEYKDSL